MLFFSVVVGVQAMWLCSYQHPHYSHARVLLCVRRIRLPLQPLYILPNSWGAPPIWLGGQQQYQQPVIKEAAITGRVRSDGGNSHVD